MKRLKIIFIITTILLFVGGTAFGESGINLSIKFYNKKIYYLNENDIYIKINLVNESGDKFKFNIARNKFFNIDFMVYTPTHLQLKHSDKFIIEKNSDQPAFFRELTLESGEEYGFIVKLTDYVQIDSPGVLVIQASFFPELNIGNSPVKILSNKLTTHIRPPIMIEEMKSLIETETGKIIEREALPPDEVVAYMLHSRQKGLWEKFFLYIDLEQLYNNNRQRAMKFKLSTETERILLLEEFKKQLMEDKIEKLMLVIPNSFEIDKTTYTKTEAVVITTQRFKYPDYTEIKRFTYNLERIDRFWLITRYTAENIGTE